MTISRSKSALFLVEGDDELFLIRNIKRYGNVKKVNLWESPNAILKLTSESKNTQEVFIVFDTDILIQTDRFIANVNRLVKTFSKATIYLAQQTEAFEDEMVRGFSLKNRAELRSKFGAASDDEFKTKFMHISSPIDYLLRNNFDIKAVWRKDIIPELAGLLSKERIQKDINYDAFKNQLLTIS